MSEPTLRERVEGSARLRSTQHLARRLVCALGRVQVVGADGVPDAGPVILAVNHRSMLDGPLLFGFLDRPVSCLVKSEAFIPALAPLLLTAGQIPVARHQVDRRPVRLCIDILRAGGVVGVFPEGTRGDGLARSAKPGVGYFALRSGATVIPAACVGTFAMTHHRRLRRPPVLLMLGRPIAVERHPDEIPLDRRRVARQAEQIRHALASLVAVADSSNPDFLQGFAA